MKVRILNNEKHYQNTRRGSKFWAADQFATAQVYWNYVFVLLQLRHLVFAIQIRAIMAVLATRIIRDLFAFVLRLIRDPYAKVSIHICYCIYTG